MKFISNEEIKNKTVLLRCDFNVSIKDNKIISNDRIVESLETINYLINNNNKIIIFSHLGKIKTEEDKKNNSLYPIYIELKKLLNTNIHFIDKTRGKELEDLIKEIDYKEIILVENTRFEDLDNNKESSCDEELSKYWASLGDVFINDAFGMTHRRHASNYGISNYLPSYYGLLIEKEIKGLELLIKPDRPYTIVMGGAKLDDKIKLIKSILPKCDNLLVCGGIANTFLKNNYNIGKSLVSDELLEETKILLQNYSNKIILPLDVKVLSNDKTIIKNVTDIEDNDYIYDIGPKTIERFKDIINKSKTIFLNGTAGKYEDERFEEGTKNILEIISKLDANTIIGGGDALSSSKYFNIDNFTFKSTGGGATLDYIAKEKLFCDKDL